MSFKLGDILIDSMDMAVATDFYDNPLYILNQLSEGTIDITADSTDVVDKKGALVRRVYKAKSGSLSVTNAMLNVSIIGAMSGAGVDDASVKSIVMPKILTVKKGATLQLPDYDASTSSVTLGGMFANGVMDTTSKFKQNTAASATEFSVSSSGLLTPPTLEEGSEISKFMALYKRAVKTGIAISNYADKFPDTVRLYIKALCADPCTPNVMRDCMIYLPSFQVSPEISLSLTTDATIEYKGDLQVDYCGDEKLMYQIFIDSDVEVAAA